MALNLWKALQVVMGEQKECYGFKKETELNVLDKTAVIVGCRHDLLITRTG